MLLILPIFVARVVTLLDFLVIVVYYYFLMIACEFLALVICVIVSLHVMSCIMFFEYFVFSDVVILFVFFSLDVFFLHASQCFCGFLFFFEVFQRFCPNVPYQECAWVCVGGVIDENDGE